MQQIDLYRVYILKLRVMETKMNKHVTVVGAINIAFGVLGILGAIVLFVCFDFVENLVTDDDVATMVMQIIKVIVPILLFVYSCIKLVGGIGLLSYKFWARYVVIVLSALSCLNIPVGTLIGVYSLWVLLQDDTLKLFKNSAEVSVVSPTV